MLGPIEQCIMPENFWRPGQKEVVPRHHHNGVQINKLSTNHHHHPVYYSAPFLLMSTITSHLPSIHEQDGYSVFTILRTNISSVSEDRPSCMMAFISSRTGYGITLDTENLGHTHTVTSTGPKYI